MQFSAAKRVRSEGDSGMMNVRGHYDGNVVGIGEIAAVVNGTWVTDDDAPSEPFDSD